ncbi:molecular chaperone [Oceaniradius stylonematis]|uniref:molecular chaperone n=1 Tax=Oceaniradius stylonematis TaxID=2184161 RepID=UPI003B5C328C
MTALSLLLSPKTWIGAAFAAALVAGWAVLSHGPAEKAAGAAQALIKADAATKDAANELSDQADQARVMRRYCRGTGRLYDFANGECER